jgi:hypothetical protein
MNPPTLPAPCATALAALEGHALEVSPAVEAHLRRCPACAEARVLLLALEDSPPCAAPEGYFEALPYRILGKVAPRRPNAKRQAALWLMAAGLVGALGMGATGFFLGRAVRQPVVEASQPHGLPDTLDAQSETPFTDDDDALSRLSDLSAADAEAALTRLQATQTQH